MAHTAIATTLVRTFQHNLQYNRLASTALLGLGLAGLIFLAACGQDGTPQANTETGPIAATVNGEAIYVSKIDAQLEGIPPQLLAGREADVRNQILSQLIDQVLVDQAADSLNATQDPDYQAELQSIVMQLKQNFVLSKYLEANLTDALVNEKYEQTKAQRAYPAVKARHILVGTEQAAQDLLKTVTPENFASMATQHSQGPTAPNGGDLGYFRKEAMVPAFAEVAFATTVGTIASAPVQTQFGWHVIYVEDKQDAFTPPLEQVADAIRGELTQELVQQYISELRQKATLVITPAEELVESAESTTEGTPTTNE